ITRRWQRQICITFTKILIPTTLANLFMITPEERTAILKVIGSKHVKKIQAYLNQNKILSPNKKSYSKTSISYILSGERENEVVENAIFAYAHQKMIEKEKQQELRDLIVSKQKL
ncbi:recombinase family protein, partial [Aquimarina sp. BL5]|uniref:recombinase family protein n=2 Tax=Aquimarina sp. BL5 TaxID=1714860 RepID=UPI001F4342A4